MAIRIRQGDLESDRSEVISGIREHLNPLSDERRYDWLYLQNPDGPAKMWVAEDTETGNIIGTTSALPRRFYLNHEEILGCVIADTWIHPDHRVLGPALRLQRACLDNIHSGLFACGYDFPRQAMPAIYQRLRVPPRDRLIDHLRLLRFDTFVANRIGNKLLSGIFASALNATFRLISPGPNQRGLAMNFVECDFGQDFSTFHLSVAGEALCVARTAEYLNWRYKSHFNKNHELVVARRDRSMVGYAVIDPNNSRPVIVDMVTTNERAVQVAILSYLIDAYRSRGCDTISISVLESSRIRPTLSKFHFRESGQAPLILIESDGFGDYFNGLLGEFCIGQEAD